MIKSKDKKSKPAEEFYDDIYFDSDEDEDDACQQNAGSKSFVNQALNLYHCVYELFNAICSK